MLFPLSYHDGPNDNVGQCSIKIESYPPCPTYFESGTYAAAIAAAIPEIIPGIPCKLFTPAVSWILNRVAK